MDLLNVVNNQTIEGTLGKYLEFKTFGLFRDKLTDIIKPYAKEGSKADIYNHLFLCPSDLSQKQNFQISGVLSPYVCLWRTSPIVWNEMFYGRSVLPRTIIYRSKGKEKAVECFFYDLSTTFDLYSSSYYKDFRDRVNQDLLDFDRIRYFDIDVSELLHECDGCITRCELKLNGLTARDNLEKEPRSFNLAAQYNLNISIPYTREGLYVENINLFVNNNMIYSKDYKE